jgi:hypothetical protein
METSTADILRCQVHEILNRLAAADKQNALEIIQIHLNHLIKK